MLALGVSLLLPLLQLVGGVLLAMLVVARGVRVSSVLALLAGGTMTAFYALLGSPVSQVVAMIAATWLPVFVIAAIWQGTRSLRLTLQLSVIVAVAALIAFRVVAGDELVFWQQAVGTIEDAYRENGVSSPFSDLLARLTDHGRPLAAQLTAAAVAMSWLFAVAQFVLGGALYGRLPGERVAFGRMRDTDFGRVLAGIFLALLLLAFATGFRPLLQAGLVLLTAFLLQGFAAVHWLHLEKHAPPAVVWMTYAVAVFVFPYGLFAIAVFGYLDAWFGIRHRLKKERGSNS